MTTMNRAVVAEWLEISQKGGGSKAEGGTRALAMCVGGRWKTLLP